MIVSWPLLNTQTRRNEKYPIYPTAKPPILHSPIVRHKHQQSAGPATKLAAALHILFAFNFGFHTIVEKIGAIVSSPVEV
jgi:hypothetical protein